GALGEADRHARRRWLLGRGVRGRLGRVDRSHRRAVDRRALRPCPGRAGRGTGRRLQGRQAWAVHEAPGLRKAADDAPARPRPRPGATFMHSDDAHCSDEPWLTSLEERFRALAGLETWIRGNPPGPDGPLPDGDHLLLRYTSVCRGPCPFFEVTLFDDGTLLWNGARQVAATGPRRATVPAERVRALVEAFAADPGGHDVRGHPDFCNATPLAAIHYRHDGRRDDRSDDHCDGLPRPLEDQIVALTGIGPWIRAPGELVRYESPRFVMTVDETGRLAWTGREHVAVAGERSASLRPDQLVALGAVLEKARGHEMDACPSTARAILSYARAGAPRKV